MNKYFGKHFTAAIAAISAIATFISTLFDLETIHNNYLYGVLGLIAILVVSFLYANWQSSIKKKIELSLLTGFKLTILEGDLFKQNGVICIPFNEYFDTHVGDGVISEDSIHGIFINKYFKDRIPELQEKIRKSLESINPIEKQTRRVSGCPIEKYPLGTCVDIREGENTYVLFALTHFDNYDIANVNREEYAEVTRCLLNHLSQKTENKQVFMPLYGTGLSRMKRNPQRILYHLVNLLDFESNRVIKGGINIVIKSLSDVNVNLTELEYSLKYSISD